MRKEVVLMKHLRFILLILILSLLLSMGAYAQDTGVMNLNIENPNTTQITMRDASGAVITPVDGIYEGAERFTLTYQGAEQGKAYVLFVLSGSNTVPTEENILYIDQKIGGADSTGTFDVYPKDVTSGGSVYISGADMGLTKLASYSPTIFTVSASRKSVPAGGTVAVDISLQNNPGIGALTLYVYYDPALLTYTDRTYGSMWTEHVLNGGGSTNSLLVEETTESAVEYDDGDNVDEQIIAISLLTDADFSSNGKLLSLAFNVAAVQANTNTSLPIVCVKASNNDSSSVGIMTITEAGAVSILLYTPGDVDGDGRFSASDALMALKISVGALNGSEPFTDVERLAANVDGEPGVTAPDALMILQRSVGKITSFSRGV
jgi:hypothetical protein